MLLKSTYNHLSVLFSVNLFISKMTHFFILSKSEKNVTRMKLRLNHVKILWEMQSESKQCDLKSEILEFHKISRGRGFSWQVLAVLKLTQNRRSWNSHSHNIHTSWSVTSSKKLSNWHAFTVAPIEIRIKYVHITDNSNKKLRHNFLTSSMLITST